VPLNYTSLTLVASHSLGISSGWVQTPTLTRSRLPAARGRAEVPALCEEWFSAYEPFLRAEFPEFGFSAAPRPPRIRVRGRGKGGRTGK
jgi:hypothetical protein